MLISVFLLSLIGRKKIGNDQEQNKKKDWKKEIFFFFFPQTTSYSDFSCSQVLQLEEFCRIEEREWSVTANWDT